MIFNADLKDYVPAVEGLHGASAVTNGDWHSANTVLEEQYSYRTNDPSASGNADQRSKCIAQRDGGVWCCGLYRHTGGSKIRRKRESAGMSVTIFFIDLIFIFQ